MRITETIPPWKMPDDERIPHAYKLIMRIWAKLIQKDGYSMWSIDLTEYYKWAEENDVEIEHNILILGEDKIRTKIMFTFWCAEDAMAFKLRWS